MSSASIPKLLKLKDYITLVGTSLGLIALICAIKGTREFLSLGFFLISISLGTDLIDGYIARKTKTVNEMGRELDSLSDSLTFGIAPAVLTFQAFKMGEIYDVIIIIGSICFALGAILRLARFNISKIPGYTGVPTPLSALLMITFFYANYFFAFGMGGNTYSFVAISSYLVPGFMILFGWFNITTYIRFGEKDKILYIIAIIFAPIFSTIGIIGLLNPNLTISMVISIFFLSIFTVGHIIIIRGFFLNRLIKKKLSHPQNE